MKNIQELYNEVMGDQTLKSQFIEAAKAGRLTDFLKEHGCGATKEDVAVFLKAKVKEDAPLSASELENASGGKCTSGTAIEMAYSILTMGTGCAMASVVSLIGEDVGTMHKGQQNEKDGRICNIN